MIKHTRKSTLLCAAATVALSTSAFAGKATVEKEAPAEPKLDVSGTLSLTVDTHFISYGADVWGAGSSWSDALFHPSLELGFKITDNVKFILGTWWDVNDNAVSSIGSSVQEVDVWAGLGVTLDKWSMTLLYQEWMYASDSERIVDFKVGYDTFLKPYVLIHGRVDGIGPAQDTGIVGVLGGAYDFKTGPVSWSVPVSVAFATDGFHGGDGGFAYVSAGLSASVPLPLPGTSLSAGVTYYHTDSDVIPNNPDDDFVTGSVGVTISF